MTNLTPAQYDRILATMNPAVLNKIAAAFVRAIDAGHDIYNPANGTSPAGNVVIAEFNQQTAALGWAPETASMMRWNVRAVGRHLILAATR